MEKDSLRRADFKTGVTLIVFCLWFLSVTFAFMPFRETYGGVTNVWYVSPWIFPAIILTLLLILSIVLTLHAAKENGHRDLVRFPAGTASFRLTGLGSLAVLMLAIASAFGLWFLVVNIKSKIAFTIEEAKWLADPSAAEIFSWWDPFAIIPLVGTSLVLLASVSVLAVASRRHRRDGPLPAENEGLRLGETGTRFVIIALLFLELVYILIPNIDFFVANLLFLTVFTTAFHIGTKTVIRRAMAVYLGAGAVVTAAKISGLFALLNGGFGYTTDLLVLVAAIGATVWIGRSPDVAGTARHSFRQCVAVAWLTPLIVTPVFRFGLLVPLPHEGVVVELMQQIRQVLRAAGVFDAIGAVIGWIL